MPGSWGQDSPVPGTAPTFPPLLQEGCAASLIRHMAKGVHDHSPVPQLAQWRQEEQPTASVPELGICAEQPLNGFQQVGHTVVPGDVLEDVDVVHEGLERREQEGKDAAQHSQAAGVLQRGGWAGLAEQRAAQQVPWEKQLGRGRGGTGHCRAPCCSSRSCWHKAGLGRRVVPGRRW